MERGFVGCDELRNFLDTNGFFIIVSVSRNNECNWYAYRELKGEFRECETNKDKWMKITVHPYQQQSSMNTNEVYRGADVSIVGDYDGQWYKISCLGIEPQKLINGFADTEARLIAACNAIDTK